MLAREHIGGHDGGGHATRGEEVAARKEILEGWGFVVRENPANGANTVPVIMEHEAATGQGAGEVTARGDGQ